MNSATIRTSLFITILSLYSFASKGQDNNSEVLIDDSIIQPWIAQKAEYQAAYHFGESEAESTLILIVDRDSCYVQIRSGYFDTIGGQEQWIIKYENLKNVHIDGNKFYSGKTNGEFVSFNFENKLFYGLRIYNPWSCWIFYSDNKGHEIGFHEGSINLLPW